VKNLLKASPSGENSVSLADAQHVVDAAIDSLALLRDGLDQQLLLAAQQVAACKGRLVVSGVGKSGIAARKIASTCASLGTPALFLHPTDAAHGDLGKMVAGDMLLCISVSGEASELLTLAAHAQRSGVVTIALTANRMGPLAKLADIVLGLPHSTEGGPIAAVPMASTVATIVMGDALAALSAKLKAFSAHQLAALHPAGRIGKILKPVQSIMHAGNRVPSVSATAGVAEVAEEIGLKGFGVAAVISEDGELLGSISDGDLRRNLGAVQHSAARDIMTTSPQCLHTNDGVDLALEIVRNHRIGAIFVTDAATGKLVGIVHVQDLLRLGLV
jgi:arabinose-5-phosphate isomerase